ncbi:sensor histidine kinase [Arthrobacter tumbae]|uniref:sensor histidine kinase n=1 Tax=Arthrobacter tumbae TaxID=163874 RepID=UPI00195EEBEA|nr:sensor histidine kinase [Arthrobacter tumbae]MBM7780411.1 signal transduction histidine kinase [Arthrobacter tumbae]
MTTPADRSVPLLPDNSVWLRGMRWWHVGFYTVLSVVVLVVLLLVDGDWTRAAMLVALGVLATAYPFLTRLQHLGSWRPTAYVVLLVCTVGLSAFLSSYGAILLFVAFPQIWMFSNTPRRGLVATAILCVVVAMGQLNLTGTDPENLRSVGLQVLVSFLGSSMIGLWIYKIIDQSEDRGQLIASLEATRAELAEAHKQQGAMAERERMSREIHDTLAQGFTSIVMLTEAAQARLRRAPTGGGIPGELAAIGETARENLREARALIASAGPSQLQGGDLLGALRRLGEATGRDGRRAEVFLPDVLPPLTSPEQIAVLRCAQEALSNVRRHSHAEEVRLTVDTQGGNLVLMVSDNGRGFPQEDSNGGYGLTSMRTRLAEISGTLAVDSAPGHGTRVTMTVPLAPHATGEIPKP